MGFTWPRISLMASHMVGRLKAVELACTASAGK
jgi:hypothetical protein